jgi:hypothetical protein
VFYERRPKYKVNLLDTRSEGSVFTCSDTEDISITTRHHDSLFVYYFVILLVVLFGIRINYLSNGRCVLFLSIYKKGDKTECCAC